MNEVAFYFRETSILVYFRENLVSLILYAFPAHFTPFYVVPYNILIILSFRLNLETD
jgi:hypothetical protein